MSEYKEYVIPIVVALISLGGTIAGLWVGYRKWREDKRAAAAKGFHLGRQGAYQELWQKVERLNVNGASSRFHNWTTPNGSRRSMPSC